MFPVTYDLTTVLLQIETCSKKSWPFRGVKLHSSGFTSVIFGGGYRKMLFLKGQDVPRSVVKKVNTARQCSVVDPSGIVKCYRLKYDMLLQVETFKDPYISAVTSNFPTARGGSSRFYSFRGWVEKISGMFYASVFPY